MDIDQIGTTENEKLRWYPMRHPLSGIELLVRYASPTRQTEFRRLCLRKGVACHVRGGGIEAAEGRFGDFLVEMARFYVVDWRGVTVKETGEPAPYDAVRLGKVLGALGSALEDLNTAISEGEFFFESGDGVST
jgi:hypothetical protein